MRLGKKLLLVTLSVVLLCFLLYQGYILVRYRMYDGYKQYISERSNTYEEGTPFTALSGGGNVPDMVLAAENDILQLYTDPVSTNVAVYDKRNGVITYACPPEADEDPVASALNKSNLKSPIYIEYFNAKRSSGRYNTYDMSIKDSQFVAESIDNGLRFIYTIGDLRVATGIVPLYIHEDRLNAFLDTLGDDAVSRNEVVMRYVPSSVAPDGFMELIEGAKGAATIRKLTAIFETMGYTEEDLVNDSLDSGVEGAVPIGFEVALEYRLEDDGLVVTVPTERIVEKGGAKIDKIHLLRYFGAAGSDEDGYILVPNGSGSLIRFNNGKTGAEDYSQYIYGLDPLAADYVVLGNAETARMPVFGIQRQGYGIFAVVEEGQTLTQVVAAVSGRATSYNNAYANFIVRGSSSLTMFGLSGSEAELPVVESELYKTVCTVRYSFLPEDYEGYSGMARYYRERLEREGVLNGTAAEGDIPLYMDMIGGVLGTKFALSVQYMGIIPMTTYEQAAEIVDAFNAAGITNQVVNYQGWFNRGYYHDVPDKISLVRQLGSKAKLEDLAAKLEAQGGKLYTDVAFQKVTFSSKRFNYPLETSRYYGGGMVAARALVDPIDYQENSTMGYVETAYDLLSPKFLSRYIDEFIKRFEKYDVTGLSLRDLGDSLQSDRKRTELINREEALEIVEAQLGKLLETGKDIMVSGGNIYALSVASDLINVPSSHNDYYIVDVEIPFYEMVVHGTAPYAGYAINLSDALDSNTAVLRLLEYGASPHFTFTYEEANEMKYTGLNRMFGTSYKNWTDMAAGIYNEVNAVLNKVSGSRILKHEIEENGLRCVTYDNGVQIIINNTAGELTYRDVTVPAGGYAVREGVAA